jgi:hypothetical protein
MLEHANSVHFTLALLAAVGFVYGLWRHDWSWILASIALSLLGHVYCWTWKGEAPSGEPGRREAVGRAVQVGGAGQTDDARFAMSTVTVVSGTESRT